MANDLDPTLPEFEPANFNFAIEDEKAMPAAWKAVGVPKRMSYREKPTKRIFYDFSQVAECVGLIKALPEDGETIHAIMNSLFKGVDLVPTIARLAGKPCRELLVITLGFNRKDVACLAEMQERGEIQSLTVVCSNFFAEKDRGAFHYAKARLKESGGRIAVSRNHSKLLLFDFGAAFYVVESSANLRSCNNIEQFCLTRSKALFHFHKTWISKMLK